MGTKRVAMCLTSKGAARTEKIRENATGIFV